MPTLERAYKEAEAIALEAAALGRLNPEQAEILRTFFADLEKNAFKVYEAGRMVAAHTYDRQEIAKFWKGESELIAADLEILQSFERVLGKAGIDFDLESTRRTFRDILQACLGHYHLHA
jgi:hypothetical protein